MTDQPATSAATTDPLHLTREQIVAHVEASHPDVEVMDSRWRVQPWMAHEADHNTHGADHAH